MKRKRFMILSGLISAMVLSGCKVINLSYSDAEKYSTFGENYTDVTGEINGKGINNLDISWLSGNVELNKTDSDSFEIYENCEEVLNKSEALHYFIDGDTLRIRYAESEADISFLDDKNLVIYIPKSLEKLEIDVTSADTKIRDITVSDIEYNATSGKIKGNVLGLKDLDIDTTSGGASLDTESLDTLDIDCTSGNVKINTATTPKEINADFTSADIILGIPADSEFTVEIDSTSGSFDTEFDITQKDDLYICGSGENEYSFDCTSGDVEINILN